MGDFLEPVFLNEKMVLNAAAYLFKGVALESENSEQTKTLTKGNISLGFKFLENFISTPSLSGDREKERQISSKSARTYTLGGLHMTVIDELEKQEKLKKIMLDPFSVPESGFVSVNALLKPVDFYQILEIVNLATPLIARFLTDFGQKINNQIFTKKVTEEIPKYSELIQSIVKSLESDYLKSKHLEMIMISPETNRPIGLIDIAIADGDPAEIKAKLTDGQFHVIGKVSRYIDENQKLSMVQRTILSTIADIIGKAVSLNKEQDKITSYQQWIENAEPIVEKFVKLSIPGPAVRIVAMSVSV